MRCAGAHTHFYLDPPMSKVRFIICMEMEKRLHYGAEFVFGGHWI